MDIFIDSNMLYTDPFFKSINNKLLLTLAKKYEVNIYLSEVVLQEILNNHSKLMNELYSKISKVNSELNNLIKMSDNIEPKNDASFHQKSLTDYYQGLIDKETIKIIKTNNKLMPELVNRSIKRIKPFSKNKEEFRDAIIWLSYVEYVKKNDIKDAIFITNNIKDFSDPNDKTKVHPDLLKDSDAFTIYLSAKNLFENIEYLKLLKKSHEKESWLSMQDLNVIQNRLKGTLEKDYFDIIYYEISYFAENYVNPSQLFTGIFDYTYLEAFGGTLTHFEIDMSEVIDDSLIFYGRIFFEINMEFYERNPLYELGDEEYFHLGSRTGYFQVGCNIETDENLEVNNLELERPTFKPTQVSVDYSESIPF
ncbi:PIN domain-containing protein [Virgibacillus ndiopensis]|uniref:PIN domain-containing protein n=1 Tax=Virgibacillus ndiopensis TaxID=2004408 RepID=UPI000C077828|nr:PIN domain-containing protein [Virgibacillus ndiopensis]